MRKPLAALGLAVIAGIGALPVADALAAQSHTKPLSTRITPTTGTSEGSSTNVSGSFTPRTSSVASTARSNSVSGAAIVQKALQYLGYPYTATGNSPSTGFSCIGFVSYVYRSLGISLPGDLGDALAYAPQVPFSQLQPGDILYFQNTVWAGLSHAAIYLGNGRFVHAEYYGYGVRISSFNNDPKDYNYWIQHYMTANRPWGGAAVTPVIGAGSTSAPVAPGVGSTSTSPTTATAQTVYTGKPGVVNTASLYVRNSPSRGGGVQTVVTQGTALTIIGKSHGWYKVQLPNGAVGWVMGKYVTRGTTLASPATSASAAPASNPNVSAQSVPQRANQVSATRPKVATAHRALTRVTAPLRVHSAPGINAPVLTSVPAGTRVTVLARSNGWVKIRTSTGQVGWIASAYTSSGSRTKVATTHPAATRTTTRGTTTRGYATNYSGPMLTASVRVHTRASLGSRVITTAVAGTRVTVLGSANGFTLVRLPNGRTGYVYSAYVRA